MLQEWNGIALVPLVLGVVEAAKQCCLPARFAPLFSLLLGVGCGFLIKAEPREAIITGLMLGLSASGLYSGTKALAGK